MKIHVVFDKQGNIISAGQADRPEPEFYDYLTPRSGPQPDRGQSVAELEVPEEHLRLPLADLVEILQVDVTAKRPVLTAKKLQ